MSTGKEVQWIESFVSVGAHAKCIKGLHAGLQSPSLHAFSQSYLIS